LVKSGQTAASEQRASVISAISILTHSIDISIIGGVVKSWRITKDAPALQTAVCLDSEIQKIGRRTVGG
jgi:hypothetical protein